MNPKNPIICTSRLADDPAFVLWSLHLQLVHSMKPNFYLAPVKETESLKGASNRVHLPLSTNALSFDSKLQPLNEPISHP